MLEDEIYLYKEATMEAASDWNRREGTDVAWRMRLLAAVANLEDSMSKILDDYDWRESRGKKPVPGLFTEFRIDPYDFERSLRVWIDENRDRNLPPLDWTLTLVDDDGPCHEMDFTWYGAMSTKKYRVVRDVEGNDVVWSEQYSSLDEAIHMRPDKELTQMYSDGKKWMRNELMKKRLIEDTYPLEMEKMSLTALRFLGFR